MFRRRPNATKIAPKHSHTVHSYVPHHFETLSCSSKSRRRGTRHTISNDNLHSKCLSETLSYVYMPAFAATRSPSCTATASSTQGSRKNSLRRRSSCRSVAPSLGPLPSTLSRSRDCDSNQVWMNSCGLSAKVCRKVRFMCEFWRDCTSMPI